MSCCLPWRRVASFVIVLLLLVPTAPTQSQDERAVRAAFIFNLTRYVEWPPGNTQLTIGVLASRETSEFLQKILDSKTSDSRTLRVLVFPALDNLADCNMLYIGEPETKNLHAILAKLDTQDVLTVGESDSFAHDGGMIGLVRVNDKIQIQLNLGAVQRTGLKLNPRLFDVARIVSTNSTHASSAERKVLRHPDPEYPAMAAKLALHGAVKLQVVIAPDGSVRRVIYQGGHPLLAAAAVKAVNTWKYEVAAAESTQNVTITF